MSNAEHALQEELEEDLAVTIAQVRGGEGAGQMAHELLRQDSGASLLVGLSEGATQAVYYDSVQWGVRFVPFDADGLDGLQATRIEKLSHRRKVEAFVREHGDGLAWVHPRFRWVIENE